eukprot:933209-Amphidinium_carterae.1
MKRGLVLHNFSDTEAEVKDLDTGSVLRAAELFKGTDALDVGAALRGQDGFNEHVQKIFGNGYDVRLGVDAKAITGKLRRSGSSRSSLGSVTPPGKRTRLSSSSGEGDKAHSQLAIADACTEEDAEECEYF